MSNLDLREFHSFLEELIDQTSGDDQRWIDSIVTSIITKHRDRLKKIQDHVNDLGIRALVRNNCRAKNRTRDGNGPNLFGEYSVAKRLAVPYYDDQGKLRWKRRRREELSCEELDGTISRWSERPTKPSKSLQDLQEVAKRIEPYRDQTDSVVVALEMAQRDGK